MTTTRTAYTHDEWIAEARRRFGDHARDWRFVCPSCGHVQSVEECHKAGVPETAVAFSCVGRWRGAGAVEIYEPDTGAGCNYAGGGLFKLDPVTVTRDSEEHTVFDFAEVAP